jgi:hypothetical protein
MSNRWLNEVWKLTAGGSSRKAVLVALADRANDNGICWPAVNDIAKRTELSPRQVQRIIRHLQGKGFVRIEREGAGTGKGRGSPRTYQLQSPTTLVGRSRVTSKAVEGDVQGLDGDATATLTINNYNHQEPSGTITATDIDTGHRSASKPGPALSSKPASSHSERESMPLGRPLELTARRIAVLPVASKKTASFLDGTKYLATFMVWVTPLSPLDEPLQFGGQHYLPVWIWWVKFADNGWEAEKHDVQAFGLIPIGSSARRILGYWSRKVQFQRSLFRIQFISGATNFREDDVTYCGRVPHDPGPCPKRSACYEALGEVSDLLARQRVVLHK